MHVRLKILAAIIFLLFFVFLYRLFYWQIIRGKDLGGQAKDQYASENYLKANRGNILAKDETWLTARTDVYLLYAELPNLKQKPEDIANKLAPLLVDDPQDKACVLEEYLRLFTLLNKKGVVWVALKNKIVPDVKKNIEALGLKGLGFEQEEGRVYPEASAAAHLLGFVGKNEDGADQGYFGLEGYYNLTLTGRPGFNKQEKDAQGRPIVTGEGKEASAIGGVDLLTNIDKTVQLILEKRLLEGVEKYQALGGTAILMRPADGAILGMSSYPAYDPAKYWLFGDELFKNPAISSIFEPGSIFKILVMASALDAGAVEPDTICDICSGPVKVEKYYIETWNKKYNPDSTMLDVIVHSDNVGMTFAAQKLGADKLYDYLDSFGIGKETGIDLQGEVTATMKPKGTWNVVDLATASFGQGIAVTPIQMIRAAGVIANDGVLVTPRVVNKFYGEGWQEEIKPKIGPRVLKKETVDKITAMMVEAANFGEAKWTYLKGFNIAGKTGTAQIPIAGHYDPEKTMASFVGFAPADNPKFIMLITLYEPKSSPWASETAAPLWYSIVKGLIPYFGIQPEN